MVSIQVAIFACELFTQRRKELTQRRKEVGSVFAPCVKIKTSWTVLNYFVTLSQTQNKLKERTKWQPKKEARSPEARAKVVEKRQRRARQNPRVAEARRSQ